MKASPGVLFAWSLVTTAASVGASALYVHTAMPSVAPAEPVAAPPTPATPPPTPPTSGAPTPPSAPLPSADLTGPGEVSMADVVTRVMPGVVNVAARQAPRANLSPYGLPAPNAHEGQSLGSGVIVSEDGLVVTNNHVVEGAIEIRVNLSDGREFAAEVVGTDAQTDMALLRLRGEAIHVQPIAYGDSSQLRQGDVVLAIGNPFGVGQTVTMGIVSAVGRADMGIAEYEDFIQTDAAINPGNSGGALISMRGELVGINTAILSRTGGSHGIGFTIPSNMVRPIVESLLRHGKVQRGWLGVTVQDLTAELAQGLGLSTTQGVLVTDVEPGSPAATAGVQRGDLIEQINGERLSSSAQLRTVVATRGADADIALTYTRSGERRQSDVHLLERPERAVAAPEGAPSAPQGFGVPPGMVPNPRIAPSAPYFGGPPNNAPSAPRVAGIEIAGMLVADLDARTRQLFGVPLFIEHGVIVADVGAGSSAAMAGLEPGDVITEVARAPVGTSEALARALQQSGGSAVLLVRRGLSSLYVLLRAR